MKLKRARSRSRNRKNRVVLIYPKNESTFIETNVLDKLDLGKLARGLCNVKYVKDGGVSVELEEAEDIGRVIKQIKSNEELNPEFNARIPSKRDPQLIIFNVNEEINERSLLNKMNLEVRKCSELNSKDVLVLTGSCLLNRWLLID